MPFPELVVRGKQETFKLVDRVRASSAFAHTDFERAAERLAAFISNAQTVFFSGVFDDGLPELLQTSHADECQATLIAAHHASHGRFNLLGYEGLAFGEPIDWHLDSVAGRRAPQVHWSLLDPLDPSSVGDSKVTWELNRHQWLVHLGQAWRLTRDERYPHTVMQSMRAWMHQNPTGIGINWASSLEVAFRLIAWSWSLLLIRDSNALTPEVFRDVEHAVEAHASHVERFLSYYFSPNTHLTGEALGLFYAGVLFPQLKHADRWRRLGASILIEQIEKQVLADGVYMERSTCYQRYSADIYLHFVILAGRAGIEVPATVRARLKSLVDVLIALRNPDGTMPHIGDADGGMLMPLSSASPDDFRATFSTAAIVFNEPTFAWAADRIATDTLWLLGTSAAETFNNAGKDAPGTPTTRAFPVGGFVSMRSGWDRDAHSMIFDAGALGCQYSAGHGHADLLSVQCSAFGEPFIVDAGTCCYTANRESRDYFRSTAAHSTVVVDGASQAEPAGPFAWRERCGAQLLRWTTTENLTYAHGYSDAYRRLADPVKHRRRIGFVNSRYWIVVDDLCGSDRHLIDLRFQFAPMQVQVDRDMWARATRDGKRGLLVRSFAPVALHPSVREGQHTPMEGWLSANYGCMQPAPALVFSAEGRFPTRMLTVLWPAEDIQNTPDIDVITDAKGRPTGIQSELEIVTFDEDDMYVRNRRNH